MNYDYIKKAISYVGKVILRTPSHLHTLIDSTIMVPVGTSEDLLPS